MDPGAIGGPVWSEIGRLLSALWLMVLFTVLFAANMLVGHNMLPSLVASHHLPDSWQRVRPVFYALALVCFVLAMVFLGQAVGLAGLLRDFWADYWI